MIRKAFVMEVNRAAHDEYARRHQPIWADLAQTLKDHGVCQYFIYLDPVTSQLFGYVEMENEERFAAIAQTEPCQRWWKFMSDIMPTNPDASPVVRNLKEVFSLCSCPLPGSAGR
jgi:L-rhamnose mutarotase